MITYYIVVTIYGGGVSMKSEVSQMDGGVSEVSISEK